MHGFAPFRDRAHAGELLGRRVAALLDSSERDRVPPLVLGLPRGGVVTAAEVARALRAPLDVFVVRKIGAPWQPELALGAVADVQGQAESFLHADTIAALAVDDAYLQHEIESEHIEALRRERAYRGARPAPEIADRTVVVVDDGIATGATVHAALQVLRRQRPRRLILATPVAPPDVLDQLRSEADELVCLISPDSFTSVGGAYDRFDQTTDEEVKSLLAMDFRADAKRAAG